MRDPAEQNAIPRGRNETPYVDRVKHVSTANIEADVHVWCIPILREQLGECAAEKEQSHGN
ncbi:MAG: hypothetical protein PHP45_03450 [Elusimicrobiales bacterium]|nr:hypothetical protein [Elusimicrobiales bacterium]